MVWKPLCLDPSDGVFGRFDLAALCGCHTLNVCCCCFDLDTPISLLLVICLLVLLFAVSVVGCLLGYSSCLVVWIPLFLDPSDGAFGRFDLAALCGCRTLNFCLFVCCPGCKQHAVQASELGSVGLVLFLWCWVGWTSRGRPRLIIYCVAFCCVVTASRSVGVLWSY